VKRRETLKRLAAIPFLGTVASVLEALPRNGASERVAHLQQPTFHVSSEAATEGAGTLSRPWDLATALGHPAEVVPGSIIELSPGVYKGDYISVLQGRADAPITVRGSSKGRVTIDGHLDIGDAKKNRMGGYTWYRDFEKTNTTGPEQQEGLTVYAPGTKLIDLVIHDNTGDGIGVWRTASDAEVYGLVIYNNGWDDPKTRGHGHGIYTQNDEGNKTIRNVISFNNFGNGIAVYGSPQAFLKHYVIEDNILFGNGTTATHSKSRELLVGGGTPLQDIKIRRQRIYTYGRGLEVGYKPEVVNEDIEYTDNYVAGSGRIAFFMSCERNIRVRNNTFVKREPGEMLEALFKDDPSKLQGEIDWNGNHYICSARPRGNGIDEAPWFCAKNYGTPQYEYFKGGIRTLQQWRDYSGLDANSTSQEVPPTGVVTFLAPHAYTAGRAHIAVYNWDKNDTVSVDVSPVLKKGTTYTVHHVFELYGPPIVSGVYAGKPISLPMKPVPAPIAARGGSKPPANPLPEFGAFVLRSIAQ